MDTENEKGLLGDFDPSELVVHDPNADTVVLEHGKQVFEKPGDLPEEFWDKDQGTYRSDEILKAYKTEQQKALGLRQKLSKGVQNVPADSSGYQIEVEGIDTDEGELEVFREIAFNNKLSQEQFNGLMRDLSEKVPGDDDEGSSEEQRQQFIEQTFEQEMSKLGDDAPQLISNLRSWGRTMVQQGVMSDDDYQVFLNMPVSADQVRVLSVMRQAAGYISDIPVRGSNISGLPSREEIDKILASPEYDRDPTLQRKVTEYFQKVHA